MLYTLRLTTLSETLVGSAQSYGSIIDSDVVFNDMGLPYIPAKRIKGLFRNAALDLCHLEGLKDIIPFNTDDIEKVFGSLGKEDPTPYVIFDNLNLSQYDSFCEWTEYLNDRYQYEFSTVTMQEYFTTLRSQTAIDTDTGMAKDHSLRTNRVLIRNLSFEGNITLRLDSKSHRDLLAYVSLYLDHIGSMRNRGFGLVGLDILDKAGNSISNELRKILEAQCTN